MWMILFCRFYRKTLPYRKMEADSSKVESPASQISGRCSLKIFMKHTVVELCSLSITSIFSISSEHTLHYYLFVDLVPHSQRSRFLRAVGRSTSGASARDGRCSEIIASWIGIVFMSSLTSIIFLCACEEKHLRVNRHVLQTKNLKICEMTAESIKVTLVDYDVATNRVESCACPISGNSIYRRYYLTYIVFEELSKIFVQI